MSETSSGKQTASSNAEQTAMRRLPRFRFSVLNLLLVTVILSMGLVIFRQWRDIEGMRKQLGASGFLHVDDQRNYYAIAVPTYDKLTWRWRVWLPPGERYQLAALCNQVPAEGFPDESTGIGVMRFGKNQSTNGLSGFSPGEKIITVAIRKEGQQQRLVFDVQSVDGRLIYRSQRTTLKQNGGIWPDKQGIVFARGGVGQLQYAQEEAVEFLLLRNRTTTSGRSIALSGPPTEGLMVWIEPLPAPSSGGGASGGGSGQSATP